MITEDAKRKIALYIKDVVTKSNIGIGGNSSNPASQDLDVPILSTKVTTTNSESDDTTVDFKAVFTGSQLQGNTIREFGLYGTFPIDTVTGIVGTAYSGGNVEEKMFARVNFEGIGPFAASDQIEFIFVIEVE